MKSRQLGWKNNGERQVETCKGQFRKNDCKRLCQEVLDTMDKTKISVCIFSLLETPKIKPLPNPTEAKEFLSKNFKEQF